MTKTIDLSKSVYQLVQQYPELIEIMDTLGFHEITKKAMLHSVGKIMTIPKGASMKHIPMETIISTLTAQGFILEDATPDANSTESASSPATSVSAPSASDSRTEKLKGYLKRLGSGETLETVRADFAGEFSNVEASEIMKAEQELMKEGTPLTEVQKLCDLHSALFHGATREERIANAEKAVNTSLVKEQQIQITNPQTYKMERTAELIRIPGHPLHTFTRENEALDRLLTQARAADGTYTDINLAKIREIAIHYAKKGDLLYPLLKVRYNVTGPADVMWTVDDEIRDAMSALLRQQPNDNYRERVNAVLRRAEEMIYKETNILFPICAVHFSEDEWQGIYQDAKDYAVCLEVTSETWPTGEAYRSAPSVDATGEIVMAGGHMTLPQLTALLNTLPLEISFVDADNINRYFNEGPKVFKRPTMAIDREVFSCHPPKVEPMVRQIIQDFRTGLRDEVPVWMNKGGRTFLVKYMAVRDRAGTYLGTLEIVQDMEFAKEHFAEQNSRTGGKA
ncbi:DUF438 domain-containing protein [Selenomonas sp. KH1T6]|uniref:DUF438 domain-containing protein n=1 Tax=Selenomonas sp. KH1T6 TaxID=3158784 RepID=UPI0008A73661|nr:hypothetical protein SAMN05216583_13122 [Selenomonas ruminantium]